MRHARLVASALFRTTYSYPRISSTMPSSMMPPEPASLPLEARSSKWYKYAIRAAESDSPTLKR